jgi:hypothetical protein
MRSNRVRDWSNWAHSTHIALIAHIPFPILNCSAVQAVEPHLVRCNASALVGSLYTVAQGRMPKKEPEAMDVEAEPEPELPTIVPRPEQVSLESAPRPAPRLLRSPRRVSSHALECSSSCLHG